jgi:quercetin dioxygenase-like cupin family protein
MEAWQLGELEVEAHHPRVLRSDDGATRIVALALPAGELFQEHQVHEHALVLVVDGELRIRSGGGEQRAGPGTLVHFAPAERHEVEAASDAKIVLLLSPWPGPGHPSLI